MSIPNLTELTERLKNHPDVLQFKNSLKYVQTSTSISLDRLPAVLDALCVKLYLEGQRDALEESRKQLAEGLQTKQPHAPSIPRPITGPTK